VSFNCLFDVSLGYKKNNTIFLIRSCYFIVASVPRERGGKLSSVVGRNTVRSDVGSGRTATDLL
jgi:hypothetical protein